MSLTELPASALLILVLILTAISAFFSGSETAMIGLNRYRLRHLVKQKHRGARKANRLLRRPDRLLGVILLGNNLANFTAASLATVIGLRLFGDAGVVSAPVLLTVFFLIFAEVAPKTIAARAPERLAFPAAHVLQPLLKFFYPGIVCINAIANFLVRPFLPNTSADEDNTLSVEELRTVVNEGAEIPGQGQNMLLGILDLEKVSVNDIMVPRSEIVGIDIDAEMSDVLQILANSQHTRLPIYKENINNILGLLHLRRVARYLPRKEREEDLTKAELMQLTSEPYYVPEGTPLHTQLFNFKKEKQRIALVVDEYGEIEGIVTLEDILEEIVGEFTTDFASKMPEIHPQDDGSYFIDGMALLRDINRGLGWEFPTHGPKTLNGLVLEHLETIPDSNLCLKIDGYLIETLHIKDNVIKNIKVTREARPAANPASDD
jgi:Mg2+/Co2+ transporter CorB